VAVSEYVAKAGKPPEVLEQMLRYKAKAVGRLVASSKSRKCSVALDIKEFVGSLVLDHKAAKNGCQCLLKCAYGQQDAWQGIFVIERVQKVLIVFREFLDRRGSAGHMIPPMMGTGPRPWKALPWSVFGVLRPLAVSAGLT